MGTSWREWVKHGKKGPPTNPIWKQFESPAAARRAHSYDYEGSGKTTWRYFKAKAIAKKLRKVWYHG